MILIDPPQGGQQIGSIGLSEIKSPHSYQANNAKAVDIVMKTSAYQLKR